MPATLFRLLAALLACCALAGGAALAQPAGAAGKKTVLMLSSERADFPAGGQARRGPGLRRGVAAADGSVKIFAESRAYGRSPPQRHDAALVAYLRDRYRDAKIDAVVTLHGAAFEFAIAHRAALFPDAPIVAAG